MTWRTKAASLEQGRIPYLEGGDPQAARVLLLIHAFPVGMRLWDPVVPPSGWRALAPALPGFDGAPPPGRDSTSIDDYARTILAFMDHVGINDAVIGGVSMGGYVSFALWRLDRRRWRGLMLADTRAGADSATARAGRDRMLQAIQSRGMRGVADDMLPKLLGATTRTQQPELVDHVRRLIERQTDEGIRAAVVRLRDRPDSTPLLRDIDVPVLVVVGEEDEVTPPPEAEALRSQIAEAHLARIPAAGHLACMENAPAFNQSLVEFLDRLR